MRLLALLVTTLVFAGEVSANVFDPQASFLSVRIGAVFGLPLAGNSQAASRAVLTGPAGSEVIVQRGMGMGAPNIWETKGLSGGSEFFTGTPLVTNIFLTVQNGSGTFSQDSTGGVFQNSVLCPTGCFGGVAPLRGRSVTEILSILHAPTTLNVVGAPDGPQQFATPRIGALAATIFAEGAQWITGSVTITNIATNIISITAGPRSGQTGVAFTLQLTAFESAEPTASGENGITAVTVAGTTSFSPATGGTGVNQVTLISPVHIDASILTGNPPVPGLGIEVLRFVPEPTSLILLAAGVAGLLAIGRDRTRR